MSSSPLGMAWSRHRIGSGNSSMGSMIRPDPEILLLVGPGRFVVYGPVSRNPRQSLPTFCSEGALNVQADHVCRG
jgi:hypothetical protein